MPHALVAAGRKPRGVKSNSHHDAHGRFAEADEGGDEPNVSSEDAAAFAKHDDRLAAATNKIAALHDQLADHLDALKSIQKKLGGATKDGNAAHDAVNAIRSKYDLEEYEKEGSVLEHGEQLHDALGEAVNALSEHVGDKYGVKSTAIPTADFFESAIAFKFLPAETQGLPQGEFKGYGAIFGNVDSHGDIIEPGAFADTLAERKAQGRGTPPMHVMHSFFGGDGLPAGKWKDVAEDSKGLRVHGKVSGMNTDTGKMHFARVADGAYGGLSIGYSVPEGGSRKPTAEEKARGAKRVLTKVDLHEISLVDEPSNAQAKFDEMKAARLRDERKEISTIGAEGAPPTDPQAALTRAAVSIRAAMALHAGCMLGGDAPDAGERADFLEHLQDAHEALTGQRTPDDMKSLPDKRKAEKALRDAGLSRSQARDVVDVGFKTLHGLRDAPGGQTTPPGDDDAAVKTARDALAFLL